MINRNHIFGLLILVTAITHGQILSGKVIDAKTQQPLETVSVYFDNTTIGTTTDENGNFSIQYTDAVQSTLVVSYLGYQKVFISDYRNLTDITVELKEYINQLDEVVIDADDGLTRSQKLRLFRKEFLGTSEYAKSCKIVNEDDIRLRYNKRQRVLSATSKGPLIVKNKRLQYEISFDIIDFEIGFRYVEPDRNIFSINSVTYKGTTFYKDLDKGQKQKIHKRREKAHTGSVQHFMRALYNENLKEKGYSIFHKGFKVDEWQYLKIEPVQDSKIKSVSLDTKLSILFDKNARSELQLLHVANFLVDVYGNYSPIEGVLFSGFMGSQRLGDALPSDYGIESKE